MTEFGPGHRHISFRNTVKRKSPCLRVSVSPCLRVSVSPCLRVFQLPTSNFQLPTPNSQLPTPNSQLPTSNSQLPTPNSQLPTPNSQLPTPNSQLPTPNSQLPTPNSQLGGKICRLHRHRAACLHNFIPFLTREGVGLNLLPPLTDLSQATLLSSASRLTGG
ncbi:KAR9 family protein [Roseimaritima multifibrata]|uniref:hypothetical protein n=1 Tax=Roseimaritima multifibrata TaxID=1930274 RepID=UPI003703A883